MALVDYVDFLLAGGLTDALTELGVDAKQKELIELKNLDELKKLSDENLKALQEEVAEQKKREAANKAQRQRYESLIDDALFNSLGGRLGITPVPE